MKFIKLIEQTLKSEPSSILLNTDEIQSIGSSYPEEPHLGTRIALKSTGTGARFYFVRETVEEVYAILNLQAATNQ